LGKESKPIRVLDQDRSEFHEFYVEFYIGIYECGFNAKYISCFVIAKKSY